MRDAIDAELAHRQRLISPYAFPDGTLLVCRKYRNSSEEKRTLYFRKKFCSLQGGFMKSNGRFHVFTLGVIALLLCSVATVFTLRSPSAVKAASAPTGLHVVGNRIQDSSGNIIIPRGVNRMGGEYACLSGLSFDGPITQTVVDAMLTWKVNTVRVPLNEQCWLGINSLPASPLTVSQYRTDVQTWVNLLTANGIIPIVEMHWNNGGTNQATGQQPMPDLDHSPAFWTSVANTFKSNSSVLFDLHNEPFPGFNNATTTGWLCWKNGSTAPQTSPCADVGFAVAGMQTLVNTVRATGATNIIMLGGLAFSNDLSQWLANKPTDSLNNLVASVHIYNFNTCSNTSCWDSQIAPVAASVPVIAGEIGENDCAHGFIDLLMSWFDSHNIGYLAWTWNGYNCNTTPALITTQDGTSSNPTAYGQGFRDHLLALAGMGTPTPMPTLTPTLTPTPTSTPTLTPTPTSTPTMTPTTGTGSGCRVHYAITNQWNTGFGTTITITNTGSTVINGWSLRFSFANGQIITQLWNGTYTQSGSAVTVTNVSYNGNIPAGATISSVPGFNANWSGTNTAPTAFTLNGVTCSVV